MPINQSNQKGKLGNEDTNRPQYNKVFIQRDYSSGTTVKFLTTFPPELERRGFDRETFTLTIHQINSYYEEAEKAACSTYCEGCLACLTAYLIYLCSQTHYEKCLRKVSKFIAEQNQTIYEPKNLRITDPIERGLRVVSFYPLFKDCSMFNKQIEISILDEPSVSRT